MRRRVLLILALVLALLLLSLWLPLPERQSVPPPQRLSVRDTLGGVGAEGFARVTAPRPFRFPADHGPHEAYRHEWWYFTGNLRGADGRRFGYQLTFFRFGLDPRPASRASRWAASQAWMAHLAVTDGSGQRFVNFERFSRGALGLAGASAQPFRVWLEEWSAAATGEESFPLRLRAGEGGTAIDLTLAAGKPVVLPGDRGFSRKGPEPGNASHYYSLTRLPTRGEVRLNGQRWTVEGFSWLDREWGTSALGKDEVGWDWFALQLDDGRELMFYRLRRRDGSISPFSAGVLVAPDGSSRPLAADAVRVEPQGSWTSPRSGARYPAGWRLAVPGEGVDLAVTPLVADQELAASVVYWEGAVAVEGSTPGRSVGGSGYVELTGYGAGTGAGN